MTAMDLLDFLKARLDEDEAAAKAAADEGTPGWHAYGEDWGTARVGDDLGNVVVHNEGSPGPHEADHIARHDPARVLREVATWRRILLEYSVPPGTDAVYGGTERETGFRLALSFALKAKALEWKDHPQYQEWA